MKLFSLMGELGIKGTEEAEKQLQDVSEEGEKTKKKLSSAFEGIGTKAGELGKSMALGLAGVVTGAVAMVEGTRELRQGLGRLEAGFEGVGLSTDTAKETFKGFYAILGDEGTAIEASNLLKELTKDEQALAEWTEVATGVYARFPDAIPIEGLIESANETAKVGAITGSLADALNWATASNEDWQVALGGNQKALKAFNGAVKEGASVEDAFNEALAKCNTEAEREELLRNTLNTLYGESADAYKETNKGIMDNYNAQAELNMKMAEMAEKIEPLITKGKMFLAEVLIKLQPLLTWLIDNINIIAPLVIGFLGTLFAMNLISKIGNLKTALQGLLLLFKTNLVALAIMGVITAIVLLVQNWDTVKAKVIEVWNKIVEVWGVFAEWFKTTVIDPIVNFFTELWNTLTTIWNGIVMAVQIAVGLLASIIDAFIQIVLLPFKFIWVNFGDEITAVWNWIVEGVQSAIEAIKGVITAVSTWFAEIFTAIKDTIVGAFTSVVEWITGFWNDIQVMFMEGGGGLAGIVEVYFGLLINMINSFFTWLGDLIGVDLSGLADKISGIIRNVRDFIVNAMLEMREKLTGIFNKVKETASNIWNGIKNTASTVWNAISGAVTSAVETAKNNATERFNKIKDVASSVWNGIKDTTSRIWNGITTSISNAIGKARDAVKTAIEKIKSFFNFNVSLPKIKLPKFSIMPSGWKLGDLLEGSIPKLGITWNAEGAIFKQPTIFNTRAGLQGVGEAGAEAIAPIDKLMGYTRQAVSESNYGLAEKLDVLIDLLSTSLPTLAQRQVVLSTGEMVGALVNPLDRALAELTEDRRRGR